MSIIYRIKNSYSYGGTKEVIRKAWFWGIYALVGLSTRRSICNRKSEYGLSTEERKEKIIVSLTSFPARFPYIGMCLKSLILQDFKPNKIIVYLGSDSTPEMFTGQMIEFQKYGIEYRFDCEKNLMSHKKYFYAMQEHPDAVIVTADDDVMYPHNWLKTLYDSYKNNPNAISARRVHQIIFDEQGKMIPYDRWKDQCRKIRKPSMKLIATGNGGVLYPPHCFDDEVFNTDVFSELCLRADDLWLKCMEVRNRIPVVWVKNWQVMPVPIDFGSNSRLQDENIFTGKNDEILNKMMKYYSLRDEDFI